jgi:hypothetical protein
VNNGNERVNSFGLRHYALNAKPVPLTSPLLNDEAIAPPPWSAKNTIENYELLLLSKYIFAF